MGGPSSLTRAEWRLLRRVHASGAGLGGQALGLLTILLTTSCSGEDLGARELHTTRWETVWQAGDTSHGGMLPSPGLMVYNRGVLFVFDNAMSHLVALDGENGMLLGVSGRAGHGPGEFAGVSAMYPDPEGGVAVVDINNLRITRFNGQGEVTGAISLGTIGGLPNQICPLVNNQFLVSDVWNPRYLVMDTAGHRVAELDLVWSDLDSVPLQTRHALIRGATSGGKCFIGLATGRGFAIVESGKAPLHIEYQEPFDVFGLGARAGEPGAAYWAINDAVFADSEVFVLFSGQTRSKNRLIDRYDLGTGRYLGSDLLPVATYSLAAGDGRVYVIEDWTRILALRPH